MKTFIFAVLIAVIAASPAAAAKKKSKKVVAAPVAASASNNENSARFVRDAFPIFLPSWLMPVYVANTNRR